MHTVSMLSNSALCGTGQPFLWLYIANSTFEQKSYHCTTLSGLNKNGFAQSGLLYGPIYTLQIVL